MIVLVKKFRLIVALVLYLGVLLTAYSSYAQNCVISANLTLTPPATGGVIGPGVTVQFCYTISVYNGAAVNWHHGVVPRFDPGWDVSTLVPFGQPASLDGNGAWLWVSSVTSTANGNTVTGPGWFYDSATGGPLDGDPGNNYGDNGTGPWTFCWEITTNSGSLCNPADSLNVEIETYGDSETGSWANTGCTTDPNFFSPPTALNCCPQAILTTADPTCSNTTDGFIHIDGQGPAPWDYVWANDTGLVIQSTLGSFGPDSMMNISGGTFIITITDDSNCVSTLNVTLTSPNPVNAIAIGTNPGCSGANDGFIQGFPTGPGPWLYEWYTVAGSFLESNGPLLNRDTIFNLTAGTYVLAVTTGTGCTGYDTISLTQPPPTTAVIVDTVDASCGNAGDGFAFTTGSGQLPWSYLWQDINGVTLQNSTGMSGPDTLFGLNPGVYVAFVTDSFGCGGVDTFSINGQPPIVVSVVVTDPSCSGANDGAIDLTVSGGNPGFTFVWSNNSVVEDQVNLLAGVYTVTVTDNNNCTHVDSFMIVDPVSIALSTFATPAPCPGINTGQINLSVIGGMAPFSFNWSNGLMVEDINGLSPGIYTVTVTDSTGCSQIATDTVGILDSVSLIAVVAGVSCFGGNDGAVDLTVSGGTLPYTFGWSNSSLTEDISGLVAGIYDVMVTDINGCSGVLSTTVAEPALALSVVSIVVTDANCAGSSTGFIDLSVVGGTSPYSFNWSNAAVTEDLSSVSAGNYYVTINDANNCQLFDSALVTEPTALSIVMDSTDEYCTDADGTASVSVVGGIGPYTYLWSNSQQTSTAINLSAGSYSVTVTDNVGCTIVGSVIVNVNGLPIATSVSTPASCSGSLDGLIDVSVNGGLVPYFFIWSNGQTLEDLTNVQPGSYSVTITDALGCSITHSNTITQPSAFNPTIIPTLISCNGMTDGGVDLTISGATPPYSFAWSNGDVSEDLTNLGPGQYDVTITDANMCTFSAGATISEPSAMTVTDSIVDARCVLATGEIYVSPIGGTVPYTYQWSDGSGTQNVTSLYSGTYDVTITDANGCTLSGNYFVDDSPVLTVDAGPDDTIRIGTSTILTAGFGNPADVSSWSWSPNADLSCTDTCNPVSNPLFTTTYTLSAQDIYGCNYEDEITIVVESNPVVFIPNVFTPDGDGINDLFFVQGKEIADLKLAVYDRWGQRLFLGNELADAWDGTFQGAKLSPDVFVYYAEVTFLTGKEEFYRGSVTIVK